MPEMRQNAYRVEVGRPDEYDRAKILLNAGKHPTFVGREIIARCARNGGLLFFVVEDKDAAVAAINTRKNVLLVLNVHPKYRGRRLGQHIVEFIKPNFVRAVESAVPWFERLGYVSVGIWKMGRSLRTRVMVRSSLRTLAGRLRSRLEIPSGPIFEADSDSTR
jgi:GNAT superfamily N-acetyltransferase